MGKTRDETVERLARVAKEEADRGSVASAAAATYFEEREPPATRNTTSIEWTHQEGYIGSTWNPTRGCSRVSDGCVHCYAEVLAGRFSNEGLWGHGYATRGKAGHRWTGKVELIPSKLAEPLTWRKPRRVFVNSMSDLFHEKLTFDQIAAVIGVIAACPDSIFMTLTKRAARMREWFEWAESRCTSNLAMFCKRMAERQTGHDPATFDNPIWATRRGEEWPLKNWQVGVSAEDQQRWDERVPELLRCPAAVRFVSAEPLLGPIDSWSKPGCRRLSAGLHQIIIGGESGRGARPCHVEWIRDLIAQCRAAGVKPFVKQLGAYPVAVVPLFLKDKKGGDPSEWPEDLRVREQA